VTFVRQSIQDGADYIKLMNESGAAVGLDLPLLSLTVQTAVADAAHAHGLVTVAHALTGNDTLAVLHAGVDGLTHCFFDKPMNELVLAAYKRNNAWCNPTLVAIGPFIDW
jgi:imidazolonepropionase-like amidohydrolase